MNTNIAGTIDRPLTHDPKKQAPMKPSTNEPAGATPEDFTMSGAMDSRQNRTREMQLIPEALARAHTHELLHEASDTEAVRRRPPVGCSAGPSAPRCAPAARSPWPSCSSPEHT
ncbi:hypothetical protein SALBM311S_06450 [Streptomyces alboniger]